MYASPQQGPATERHTKSRANTGNFSFFFILFTFLLSFSSRAQNWSPVSLNGRYNYSLNGDPLVTATLLVDSFHVHINDSMNVSAGDTVFFMNRVVCDSCATFVSIPGICNSCYGLMNQSQFLRLRVRRGIGGGYNFRSPGSVNFPANAHLGAYWLLDTAANIRARIIAEDTASTVYGTDSIKIIALPSSLDTIILSKNSGILQYPQKYGSHKYYKLVGIEGRPAGISVPGMKQIFDFNVGDVYEYHQNVYAANGPFYGFRLYKYTVSSRRISGDSLVYHFQGMNYQKQGSSPNTGIRRSCAGCFSVFSQDVVYKDSLRHMANAWNHGLLTLPITVPTHSAGLNFMRFRTDSNGVFNKVFGYFNNPDLPYCFGEYNQSDTLIPFSKNTRLTSSLCQVYKPGLGLTDYYSNDNAGNTDEYHLLAWKKGALSSGSFTPDSLLTGISALVENSIRISAYPNPVSDKLFIQISSHSDGTVQLIDVQGRIILEKTLHGIQQWMDVSRLPAGMYILRLDCGKETVFRKILKTDQ